MNCRRKTPCSQCPFIRDRALRGFLPRSAEDYYQELHAEKTFPCHKDYYREAEKSADGETPDDMDKVNHCVGAAMVRRKLCKIPRDHEQAGFQGSLDVACTKFADDLLWRRDDFCEVHTNAMR